MKELVDKKRLLRKIAEGEADFKMKPRKILYSSDILSKTKLVGVIEKTCILSPAELAEILKGKAWVLEELKKSLIRRAESVLWDSGYNEAIGYIKATLQTLEDQTPVSELVPFDEDRRKAEALKKLKRWLKEYYPPGKGICGTDCQITTGIVLDKINELLAQSKEEKP